MKQYITSRSIKIFDNLIYVGGTADIFNDEAKLLIQNINLLKNQNNFFKLCFQTNAKIYITSMDRGIDPHTNGKSVDVTCIPFFLNIYLAKFIQNEWNSAYISTYNYHVHYERKSTANGALGAEVLYRNNVRYAGMSKTSYKQGDKIVIVPLQNEIYNIMAFNNMKVGLTQATTPLSTRTMLEFFGADFDAYYETYNKIWPNLIENAKSTFKDIIHDISNVWNITKFAIPLIGAGIIYFLFLRKK